MVQEGETSKGIYLDGKSKTSGPLGNIPRCVAVVLPKVEVENNITVVRRKDEFRLSGHMIKSTTDILVYVGTSV